MDAVEYTDNWRWKLVNENHLSEVSSSQSQTDEITEYFVEDRRKNKTHIKIIDTPGFGDTSGISKDLEITKKFTKLFKEDLDEIDYILITVKSNETRFTPSNRYVYDCIQQLFGKDISDRFIIMCTFSDGCLPQCIDTLTGNIHFEKYFRFNNYALYTPSHFNDSTVKMFWDLGMKNVEEFFEYIIQQNNLPASLKMSKSVLEYREWLYKSIETAQIMISEGFTELENARVLLETIKKNKNKIDKNKSFTFKVHEERIVKKPLKGVYQMCQNCNRTCCQICTWPSNAIESACTYFNSVNRCPKCNGCPKSSHVRCDYLIEKTQVEVIKEYEHMKIELREGEVGLTKSEIALGRQKEKMMNKSKDILLLQKIVKEHLSELEKIALKPRVFNNEDYFTALIEKEKDLRTPGYQKRIDELGKMVKWNQDHKTFKR